MRQGYVAFLLFAALGARSAGGEAAVREIPDVTTIEQLQKLEPVRLANGWEVRLGLGEAGAEAGPWKLLYCQAHRIGHVGKNEALPFVLNGDTYGEHLGPVFYTTLDNEAPGKAAMHGSLPADGLFCGLVLTAWAGTYNLRVVSTDGETIGRRTLRVGEPVPCYWQEFAQERQRQAEKEPAWAARRDTSAARPGYDGMGSMWPPLDRQVRLAPGREGTPLPGRIPLGGPWPSVFAGGRAEPAKEGENVQPLRLSLEGNAFLIRWEFNMSNRPDLHLLARWWVNGKPVLPPRSETMKLIQLSEMSTHETEIRVGMGWPDSLGKVQVGDNLGLQVLYSQGLVQQIPRKREAEERSLSPETEARVPLLSNRTDFAVTRALLDARERNAQQAER